MKGKAHDELHKWLLPYIELVDALTASKNADESVKYVSQIQTSFNTFNQYFK